MSRVEVLEQASNADEVDLLKLLRFYGGCGRNFVFVVEGHDDVVFLQTKVLDVRNDRREDIAYFNAKGKHAVLRLCELVDESEAVRAEDFWFFFDRDFDDFRGFKPGPRIWMTPTYSIENLLVSKKILRELLVGEYRCNDEPSLHDVEQIMAHFETFLSSYASELRFANMCALYSIRASKPIHPHEEKVTPRISVAFPQVRLHATDGELLREMPQGDEFDEADVRSCEAELDAMDPFERWRGKFLFKAFVDFLEFLRKDRGAKARKCFSARARMTFNPNHDPVRALSAISPTPDCLRNFLLSIP